MAKPVRPRVAKVASETAEVSEQVAEAKEHLDAAIVDVVDSLITAAKEGSVTAGTALLRFYEGDIQGSSDRGGEIMDKVRAVRRGDNGKRPS